MTGGADVPLDAAGEPGAVEREVRGLQDRVAVEQFALGRLVEEGGHAPAETGQHGRPQPVVLDHDRVQLGRYAVSGVRVAQAGGQYRAQRFVRDLPGHLVGQPRAGVVVDPVDLVQRAQSGQRVLRAQRGGGKGEGGASHARYHYCLSQSLHPRPPRCNRVITMEHGVSTAEQGFRGVGLIPLRGVDGGPGTLWPCHQRVVGARPSLPPRPGRRAAPSQAQALKSTPPSVVMP